MTKVTPIELPSKSPRTVDDVPFRKLFQPNRIKRKLSFFQKLILAFWFPIGCALVFFRLFICFFFGVFLFTVTPKSLVQYTLKYFLTPFCGFRVSVKYADPSRKEESLSSRIFVSNHVHELDAFAFQYIKLATVTMYKVAGNWIRFTPFRVLDPIFVPKPSSQGGDDRSVVRRAILSRIQKPDGRPLLNFPEGGLTNGRHGVLMFHRYVFSLGETITPLALKITGPMENIIEVDTLFSTFLGNMCALFFAPWVLFEFTVLPPVKLEEGETPAAFAARTQRLIANELNLSATSYPYRLKRFYGPQIGKGVPEEEAEKIAFKQYQASQDAARAAHSMTSDSEYELSSHNMAPSPSQSAPSFEKLLSGNNSSHSTSISPSSSEPLKQRQGSGASYRVE